MSAGHHEKGITVISAKKKWAAIAASAVMGLAVIVPSMPAQAAEGNATTGERVMVLKGATLKENIKLQYRIDVTKVTNGIVKGVQMWRDCGEHAQACKTNATGGQGWFGKGPVVLVETPWAGGYAGMSKVGRITATFAPDGSIDVAYEIDLKKLGSLRGIRKGVNWYSCANDPDYCTYNAS